MHFNVVLMHVYIESQRVHEFCNNDALLQSSPVYASLMVLTLEGQCACKTWLAVAIPLA